MNKFLTKADKGFGCLVTIAAIIAVVLILMSTVYLIGEMINFLAFYFHWLLMVLIIGGLCYVYYLHPKFAPEESNTLVGGNRILLTIAGFLALGLLYSFPQFFRMYNDGNYCAEVEYETSQGYSTVYIPLSVENGEVVKLYWGNGGYLDETHFNGAIVDGDGTAYFTDDRDREFYVELISRGGACAN